VRERDPLSDSEFVGRFERRAAAAADDGGTIAAGERIVYFLGAIRAVEGAGIRIWRRILRACRHEEENCSTAAEMGTAVRPLNSSLLAGVPTVPNAATSLLLSALWMAPRSHLSRRSRP
jgi:hypothetical protein